MLTFILIVHFTYGEDVTAQYGERAAECQSDAISLNATHPDNQLAECRAVWTPYPKA